MSNNMSTIEFERVLKFQVVQQLNLEKTQNKYVEADASFASVLRDTIALENLRSEEKCRREEEQARLERLFTRD